MVAVIKTSHSIQRVLNYNELKVKEKNAECINAVNFLLELDKLNFTLKLNRLINWHRLMKMLNEMLYTFTC